jgi:CBS domain-containing protein
MTRDVISVTPETSLVDVAKLMLGKSVSSVPVLDAKKRLVGIVAEGDLIHRGELGTGLHRPWWQTLSLDVDQQASEFLKVHGMQASHVMTRQVVTAEESTTLGAIVDMFDRFDINRVPIVRGDQVVGVVSQRDVLRLLSGLKPPSPKQARTDAEIRKDVDALLHEAGAAIVTPISSSITCEVVDGTVRLRGVVTSEREREALEVGARSIPGVKAVDADIAVVPRHVTAI